LVRPTIESVTEVEVLNHHSFHLMVGEAEINELRRKVAL